MLALYYKRRNTDKDLIKISEFESIDDMYKELLSFNGACLCGTYIAINDKFIWQLKVSLNKTASEKLAEEEWRIEPGCTL